MLSTVKWRRGNIHASLTVNNSIVGCRQGNTSMSPKMLLTRVHGQQQKGRQIKSQGHELPDDLQQPLTAAAQHQQVAISRQSHVLHSQAPLPPAHTKHTYSQSAFVRRSATSGRLRASYHSTRDQSILGQVALRNCNVTRRRYKCPASVLSTAARPYWR
jgi:hypothetical protein